MTTKQLFRLNQKCARWNAANSVGTVVRYHPVIGREAFRLRKTAGPAYVMSGHTAVIFLERETGCVALDACEVAKVDG